MGGDEDSSPALGPFKATLPPSGSISDFWPESQNHVALPQGLQRTINSRQQAILASFHLLLVILGYGDFPHGKAPLAISGTEYLPWVLDKCLSVYHVFRQWSSRLARSKVHDEVEALYMQVLEDLCLPTFSSNTNFSRSTKFVLSISSSASELVKLCCSTMFSPPNQILLATLLTRLRASLEATDEQKCQPHFHEHSLKDVATENMELAIVQICLEVAKLKSLEKDLQVGRPPCAP